MTTLNVLANKGGASFLPVSLGERKDQEVSRMIEARRIAAFLTLTMAALLILSTLMAPDADARKRRPSLNIVNCPTYTGSEDTVCQGTSGRDILVGTRDSNVILGQDGNDIYASGGSNQGAFPDLLADSSASNDYYYFGNVGNIGEVILVDGGGDSDTVDLSSYSTGDIDHLRLIDVNQNEFLELRIVFDNGGRITIYDFYDPEDDEPGRGFIETFRFSNATLSGQDVAEMAEVVQSTTTQETSTTANEGVSLDQGGLERLQELVAQEESSSS